MKKKRLLKLMLAAALSLTLLPFMSDEVFTSVHAETSSYYPMACGAYEVDTVNDSGTFDNQGCYSSFSSAKSAMSSLGNDAVVRHASSYSPTKIIAMNAGVAILLCKKS
jgi:hypothetical protein